MDLLLHLKAARRSCATVLDSWWPPANTLPMPMDCDKGGQLSRKGLQISALLQELLPLPLPLLVVNEGELQHQATHYGPELLQSLRGDSTLNGPLPLLGRRTAKICSAPAFLLRFP